MAAGPGAEHGEDGRVLARLGDEAVDADRLVDELVAAPRGALVRRVQQLFGRRVGLEHLTPHSRTQSSRCKCSGWFL